MAARVTFTWQPDPALYARSMLRVNAALENRTAPLLAAQETLQEDIRERFLTETAPDGSKWDEWSPAYAPVANAYPNVGILRQSTELYEVATSSEVTMIRGDTIFFNTERLPHYGLAHQFGQEDRKSNLPARPFLGMSPESEAFIFTAFSEWFDRAIDLWVTPSGKIAKRHALKGPGMTGFLTRESAGLGPM